MVNAHAEGSWLHASAEFFPLSQLLDRLHSSCIRGRPRIFSLLNSSALLHMSMLSTCWLLSWKRIVVFLCTVVNRAGILKVNSTKHDASLPGHIRIILWGAQRSLIKLSWYRAAGCKEILDLGEVLLNRLEENCCETEYSFTEWYVLPIGLLGHYLLNSQHCNTSMILPISLFIIKYITVERIV